MKHIAAIVTSSIILASCQAKDAPPVANADYAETLMTQLIDAKPGDVITIPEGRFAFNRSLSLTVDSVTIKGAGMDKSVLTFKDQIAGAEGLLVTASNFTIQDLAIEDTIGDALKVTEGENIIIRNVRTEWTDGHKTSNGAYGIYPVQTQNVLMEGNVAIGASDAGLYIGQSENVIVRNNRAEYNVAGIEIENTANADVYDNIATNNTGGILVFNMPQLSMAGDTTRVYNNQVFENNTKNFGHKGTPVAGIPAGSGVVINSNDNVEIFGNDIRDNRTANVIISSVYSAGYEGLETDDVFDPYPEGIYIYDNTFTGGGDKPDGLDLKALKTMMFGIKGRIPDVLWDGFYDPKKQVNGVTPAALKLCVQNGDAETLNADGPGGYKNPALVTADFDCSLEKLPAVELRPFK